MELIKLGKDKYLVKNSNGKIINEKERLELAESTNCDTKQYMSNEFFYEKIFNLIHWDKNHMMTEGEVSKIALRAMIEMAYKEGKMGAGNEINTFIRFTFGKACERVLDD